jgi:membrane protease YdiL (CAAX protease family)
MLANDVNSIFKSKRHAQILVGAGILLIIAFKFWKFYLRSYMGLDPSADYLLYETLSTIFRALNSIFGIALCVWGYAQFKTYSKGINRSAQLIFFVYPIAYFLIRYIFNNLIGAPNFSAELVFNVFTGISEEFLFRGMILAGLWQLIGFWPGAILSSTIFSAWHFDVGGDAFNYLSLFFASLVYSFGFASGVGLITLSMVHFIGDQIFYGLQWGSATSIAEKCVVILLDVAIIILLKRANRLRTAPVDLKI